MEVELAVKRKLNAIEAAFSLHSYLLYPSTFLFLVSFGLLFYWSLVRPCTYLTTSSIQFDYFKESYNLGEAFQVDPPAIIDNGALQITPFNEMVNPAALMNQAGRILYRSAFTLWEGQDDTDRVALVNLNRVANSIPGEGLAFVVAPDLNLPPYSSGEYLGLTNFLTDGNKTNCLIAIELDTFKQDFDPDSNHVGLNINSVRSHITANLTALGFQLVGEGNTSNFFNLWVQYDGIKKVIEVYMAQQTYKTDPTPPRPADPILTSNLDLREVVNPDSYFGFSASTSNVTQLNCVLRWNLTVEHYYQSLLKIFGLDIGISGFALLLTVVLYATRCPKKMSSVLSKWQISRRMRSLTGMPVPFRYRDLQRATNNFDEKNMLGQGGYGKVYKGSIEGLEVAVKVFLKGRPDDHFFQELTIINQLRHINLVPLRGWSHDRYEKLLLVYEYMPNGSLDKHLFVDANSKPLCWDCRDRIISDVASALHYLHNEFKPMVIHRDIKASNIMLDSNFNARLGDFGLAQALEAEKTSYIELAGIPGTKGYVAPEYIHTGKATEQSDVYAFGAVLLEVVCGRMPGANIGDYMSLLDWVWALYGEDRLLEAVDGRLMKDYDKEKAEIILLLGLACSHPKASERPKTPEIVEILKGFLPVPEVPLSKPHFEPPLLIPESPDTTNITIIVTDSSNFSDRDEAKFTEAFNGELKRKPDRQVSIVGGTSSGVGSYEELNQGEDEINQGEDESVDGRVIGKLFVSGRVIGMGSNGTIVFEGAYEGRLVAVKRLVKACHDVADKEHRNLIASDSHPNIVRLYGKESDRDFVYLALECCTCSLNDLIHKPTTEVTAPPEGTLPDKLWTDEGYPLPKLFTLMRDMVSGIVHLHETVRIVHRDMKPQNVLVTIKEGSFCAKLSDMGISKHLVADKSSIGANATGCGTSGWQAPEQLLNGRQTRAVDMFSLGCVLFYCITRGKHPFGDPHERDRNIVESEPDLSIVEHIPEAEDLLSRLLLRNAELRLKALEVLIHPMLWNSEKRLLFLCDASDWLERKGGGPDTSKPSVLKELGNIAPLVLGTKSASEPDKNMKLSNWDEKIEPALVNDRKSNRNTKQYEYDSVRDLLRLIRNKSNHFVDLPQDIQEKIGPKPEGYDAYFRSRFPKLLIEVYKVLLKHCGKEKEFNKYFEGVDQKIFSTASIKTCTLN